jgi:membrane fusion protein, multidrug efflux system
MRLITTGDCAMRFAMLRPSRLHEKTAFLAALALSLGACGDGDVAMPPPDGARPVHVADVRSAPRDSSVRAVGRLAPKDELALAFKIGGVIERIEVDEGDAVRRGALLAVLERTEIDAAVERAAESVGKAERDLKRTRALYAEDVATLEQVEDLTTALNIARANLDAARFDARYARIEAPADGVVLARRADPSELIAAGAPVLVVGDLERGWSVRAAVTDRDVVQLAVGDKARVTFDAFPSDVFATHIERIASASDPATGTYEIELAIEPDGKPFVAGLVAKVELEIRGGDRLWIPVEALLEADGDYASVFVLASDDLVERRRVRIGVLSDESVEVREGLSLGEQVVTDGAAWLAEGARVAVMATTNRGL